jgi:transposase-like protein
MDERLRFVARLLDGEAMSEVCRALGISHKTRSGSVEQPYTDQRR